MKFLHSFIDNNVIDKQITDKTRMEHYFFLFVDPISRTEKEVFVKLSRNSVGNLYLK